MGARRADASERTFFDQFEKVRVSRFRAMGVIDPAKNQAVIPMGGKEKLINVSHTRFPSGGGWSFFRCPQCSRRASTLYVISDKPLCVRCCDAMNIKHASKYGFGRDARRKARDRVLDALIAKVETNESLRYKPAPAHWRGKAKHVYHSQRLQEAMRRRLIELRLEQLATQQASERAFDDDTLKTYRPSAEAGQLIDLTPIWRANSPETLAQALDKAQITIIAALESDDQQQRLNAAKLLLRTKQARDRGL
jgi:hypothetical protein